MPKGWSPQTGKTTPRYSPEVPISELHLPENLGEDKKWTLTSIQNILNSFSEEVSSDKELMVNTVNSKYVTHFRDMRNRGTALAIFVSSLVFGIKDFQEIAPISPFLLLILIASLSAGVSLFLYYERKTSNAVELVRKLEVGYLRILIRLYFMKGYFGGASLAINELTSNQLRLFPSLVIILHFIRIELHDAFQAWISSGFLDQEDKTDFKALAESQEGSTQAAYRLYKSIEQELKKEVKLYTAFLLMLSPLIQRYEDPASK